MLVRSFAVGTVLDFARTEGELLTKPAVLMGVCDVGMRLYV